jgi:tetratricopeptide (TPR) repeat protein
MKRFTTITAVAALAAIGASSLPALAQYANEFTLAKVSRMGTSSHAVAGSGTVTVQVQVNADGTHKVVRVIKSTNPGDNAAAMDIAATSSYTPAKRGNKAETSFYDFTLKFNGKSVAQSTEDEGGAGGAPVAGGGGTIDTLIRAGKYQQAISAANSALASNPNDQQTLQLLGVAQYYNNDLPGAAGTFDKVSSVSKNFAPIAAQSYANVAVKAAQSNPDQALAYAHKAVALAPDNNSKFALGVAQLANKQYADAITSLKGVHDSVTDPKAKLNIDTELLQAYLATNDTAGAQQMAAEMKTLDPNGASASHAMAQHYLQIGADDLNAKKFNDALAAFDQASSQGNAGDAVTANTYASFAILQMDKPDYAKARDYALKALASSPNDAQANYAAGVAYAGIYSSSQKSDDKKQALDYLNKADEYAKAAGNTALASQVEAQIKNVPH